MVLGFGAPVLVELPVAARGLTHASGLVLENDTDFYFVALPAEAFEPRGQVSRVPTSGGQAEVTFAQIALDRVVALPAEANSRGPLIEFAEVPSIQSLAKCYFSSGSEAAGPTGAARSAQAALPTSGPASSAPLRPVPTPPRSPRTVGQGSPAVDPLSQIMDLLHDLKASQDLQAREIATLKHSSRQPLAPAQSRRSGRTWEAVLGDSSEESADLDAAPSFGRPASGSAARTSSPGLGQQPADPSAGAAPSTASQMDILLQLVKAIKGKSKDSDSDEENGRGKSGDLAELQRLRRQIREHPKRVLERYNMDIREKLGVTSDLTPWHYRDNSKRVASRFGRMRSLLRLHYYTSDILFCLTHNRVDEGVALVVQLQKALVQSGIDGGNWSSAVHLFPTSDPLGGEEFGGDEHEMRAVARYRKAVSELKSKLREKDTTAAEEDGGQAEPSGAKGAGKNKRDRPRRAPEKEQ
jgi:hypothetical protein